MCATPVTVVYYAYLSPNRWQCIVNGQLNDLVNVGLTNRCMVHVVLCGDARQLIAARQTVRSILKHFHHHIHETQQNQFEYPGIKLVHDLALANPDHVFLYFHSKGMVFHEQQARLPEERALFEHVVRPWRHVLSLFETLPHVNKIGFGASLAGFMWGNFWWARGTYLARCQPPVVTDDRFSCEAWIGHCGPCMSYIDCFSLHSNNEKPYYTPGEVTDAWTVEATKL